MADFQRFWLILAGGRQIPINAARSSLSMGDGLSQFLGILTVRNTFLMPTVISHLCGVFFSEHRGSLFLFLLISQVFHGFYHICFSLDLTVRLSNSFPTNYLNLPQILSILFGFFANLSIYFSNSSSQNTGTRHKSLAVLSSCIFYSSIIIARSIKKGLPQFVLVSENNTLIIPVTAARCLQRGYMGTA